MTFQDNILLILLILNSHSLDGQVNVKDYDISV